MLEGGPGPGAQGPGPPEFSRGEQNTNYYILLIDQAKNKPPGRGRRRGHPGNQFNDLYDL